MNQYSNKQTRKKVVLALFAAIIILQTWVPFLGYIALPGLAITIVHITVIIVTLLMGRTSGMLIGGVWGVNSLLRALLIGNPFERLVFTNPLISVLPRVTMPFVVGTVDRMLVQRGMSKRNRGIIAGMIGTLSNTVLVLGGIGLLRSNEYLSLIHAGAGDTIWKILGGIVVVNGVPEIIIAMILTPTLTVALDRVARRF